MSAKPPKCKYKYTLVIRGNSHEEIQHELLLQLNGGYLLDSDYETRDEFDVYGGRDHSTLEHVNPEMTPERYGVEFEEWRAARKAESDRKSHVSGSPA